MRLQAHSNEWYDRLSRMQRGYYYPWRSKLGEGDGETAFLVAVDSALDPRFDVLDIGCGSGELTLELAPRCSTIVGYDRVAGFIAEADERRNRDQVSNVVFRLHDSKDPSGRGRARVPCDDHSIDLAVSRRGPTHWIADAPRFCRNGAQLIQLNPCGRLQTPVWASALPSALQPLVEPAADDPDGMSRIIQHRIDEAGITLRSLSQHDVPEWFASPRDLFARLTFGEDPEDIPTWPEVEADLTALFQRYATGPGLEDLHRRLLWTAIVQP